MAEGSRFSSEINKSSRRIFSPGSGCVLLLWLQSVREQQAQTDWHLKIGFILLAALLLLEPEPPWAAAPFPEGLLEFISADFWNTSMVALAMFSSSEYSSCRRGGKKQQKNKISRDQLKSAATKNSCARRAGKNVAERRNLRCLCSV